ncbi:MAG: 4'-phosphopantetheinyl transferase superfamily protein [bacterium]|nr:4'-phosphopantetheinyl transferase superfamily protein [bacterium]
MNRTGIGIDIEAVALFRAQAYETHKIFYQSIFSAGEISYCLGKADAVLSFTGKFCAKEAFLKASRKNNIFLISDIEIINNKQGEPEVYYKGEKQKCLISIAHTSEIAIAMCLIT